MPSATTPVLAWESLLGRYGGDGPFLEDLVGCFLVDLEGYLVRLEQCRQAGDHEALLELTAKIRAEAERVGALAVAETARSIEVETLDDLLPALAREAERLETAARARKR